VSAAARRGLLPWVAGRRQALAAMALVVASCGSGLPTAVLPSPPPPQAAPAPPSAPPCDPTASLRPQGALPQPGAMPAGTFMRQIQDRGRLVAAVSRDLLGFGYLDPATNQLRGFDVDIARLIGRAIFGDDQHIEFKLITVPQRFTAPATGGVDLTAYAATVTCTRWQMVAFSSVYYEAGQRVLVPKASAAISLDDLGGKTVCGPAASTSAENIARVPSHPILVTADDPSDCLVLLQEGRVDAISTDDTILAGFAAQDPYVKVVGPKFTNEPYGIAMSLEHPEFVRFVNSVLEQMRTNGTWTAEYNRWLSSLGPAPAPPAAKYRD
jgi:polar amino acid transport system substrate-binding protein